MRDLFGSTNFIKFGIVETILSSSDAVNNLLQHEEDGVLEEGYVFNDYLSNIDSYLYGLVLLPVSNVCEVKKWIRNYIFYLYIPLVLKDVIYIVKSRFVREIIKIKSKECRIDESIRSFIITDVYDFLINTINLKEDELKSRLDKFVKDELFLEYLVVYYDIYKNKEYVIEVYLNNEELRESLKQIFDFVR